MKFTRNTRIHSLAITLLVVQLGLYAQGNSGKTTGEKIWFNIVSLDEQSFVRLLEPGEWICHSHPNQANLARSIFSKLKDKDNYVYSVGYIEIKIDPLADPKAYEMLTEINAWDNFISTNTSVSQSGDIRAFQENVTYGDFQQETFYICESAFVSYVFQNKTDKSYLYIIVAEKNLINQETCGNMLEYDLRDLSFFSDNKGVEQYFSNQEIVIKYKNDNRYLLVRKTMYENSDGSPKFFTEIREVINKELNRYLWASDFSARYFVR